MSGAQSNRLVLMLPGASKNKAFMETMMGVKQGLKPEVAQLFEFAQNPPSYSLAHRLKLLGLTVYRFLNKERIVSEFQNHFLKVYEGVRKTQFDKISLVQQIEIYKRLESDLLRKWQAPIINDYLCMVFFGLLKKLTEHWLKASGDPGSLQNDLLCGQGDLESTEPTKFLMRVAQLIDKKDAPFRDWFLNTPDSEILSDLRNRSDEVFKKFEEFLDRFGFRCINELKLEELDLHDDPSFVIQAVKSYVRNKAYSIENMEIREIEIRTQAEKKVKTTISGFQQFFYFWVLKQARWAVRSRENLRFARTKIFGVVRHLFRGVGGNLVKLGELSDSRDIFYLTLDEILAYCEGRAPTVRLLELVEIRKKEYERYRETSAPPDRLLTYGPVGLSVGLPAVLSAADLLIQDRPQSTDPNVLLGTPCCPGVIEGVVRVVLTAKDAVGLNGEILVTEKTDPGWVPLYPSCSGLLIERGSLLSHSAVVARELGLPTIVGVSGGLVKKLKTGMRVRVDARIGEIRILEEP